LVRECLRCGGAPVHGQARARTALDDQDRETRRHGAHHRARRERHARRTVSLEAPGEAVMKDILVPISPGELLDKITILRIKAARMQDPDKVANVRHELGLLEKTWKDSGAAAVDLGSAEADLTRVNEKLWVIEDEIRDE